MKSARYSLAVILNLIIITGTVACNGGKKMSAVNNEGAAEVKEITAVTEMQKLMAEKAFKMPGENNPVIAHKYGADPAVRTCEQ